MGGLARLVIRPGTREVPGSSIVGREDVFEDNLETGQHLAAVEGVINSERVCWLSWLVNLNLLLVGVEIPHERASQDIIRYLVGDVCSLVTGRHNFNGQVRR